MKCPQCRCSTFQYIVAKSRHHLEDLALGVADGGVLAGLVHPQGDAVDQDHRHRRALEEGAQEDPAVRTVHTIG